VSGDVLSNDEVSALVEAAKQGQAPARDSGAGKRRSRRVRDIDFSRPSKFAQEHQRKLERAHEAFCRTASTHLSAELLTEIELEVLGVDQLTWATAVAQVPQPSINAIIDATPLGTQILMNYGWGLFVALPFVMGFTAAHIYGARQPRSAGAQIGVACLSVLLLAIGLMALAFEGLICIAMAAPLALPLAALGGFCAHVVQKNRRLQRDTAFVAILLLFTPGIEWLEHAIARPSPLFEVRSSLDIEAPPEEVWDKVIAFTEIPAPKEWMFRAGVAYPIRAEMLGRGVGAERHCVFSTGAFVEPIQIWDAPRLLKFSVRQIRPPCRSGLPISRRSAAPARLSCFRRRPVPAHPSSKWRHPARRHYLVSPRAMAVDVLEALVRRNYPSHPSASSEPYSGRSRS